MLDVISRLLDKVPALINYPAMKEALAMNGFTEKAGFFGLLLAALIFITKHVGPKTILTFFEDLSKLKNWATAPRRNQTRFCKTQISKLESIDNLESWEDVNSGAQDGTFTELDAEVTMSGRRFDSPLARLFRWYSSGLSRPSKLVDAMSRTDERLIVLLGNAGSGKSVALRRLALSMLKKACNSRRRKPIPLYVNLRALNLNSTEERQLNGERIAAFIRDQLGGQYVRDAEFLQTNWQEYLDTERWCILLDSFDEIPGILRGHALPTQVQLYERAIEEFADSAVNCRVVVAAREYKAPALRKWTKFRILPLSVARQTEFINNRVSGRALQKEVRDYVIAPSNGRFSNPLLLALLCSAVEKSGAMPTTDYDAIAAQIQQQIATGIHLKNSAICKEDALAVARTAATMIAEAQSGGLAIAERDLFESFESPHPLSATVRDIVDALLFLRIMRLDEMSNETSGKCYSFVHRRFQEALVVLALVEKRLTVSPDTLLQNGHWRDYTVTLLQSQPAEIVEPLVAHAKAIIPSLWAGVVESNSSFLSTTAKFYATEDSKFRHVVELMQEGLQFRNEAFREHLQHEVSITTEQLWNSTDLADRHIGLSLSVLARQTDIDSRVRAIVAEPASLQHRDALEMVGKARTASTVLMDWLRRYLADQTLDAKGKEALWRLDAITARLPSTVGAQVILSRGKKLRWPGNVAMKIFWPFSVAAKLVALFTYGPSLPAQDAERISTARSTEAVHRTTFGVAFTCLFAGLVVVNGLSYLTYVANGTPVSWTIVCGSVAGWLIFVHCVSNYWLRQSPKFVSPLTGVRAAFTALPSARSKLAANIKGIAGTVVFTCFTASLIGVTGYCLHAMFNLTITQMFAGFYLLATAIGVVTPIVGIARKRASMRLLESLREENRSNGVPEKEVLAKARSQMELQWWFDAAAETLFSNPNEMRSFAAWVENPNSHRHWKRKPKKEHVRRFAWSVAAVITNRK